MSNKIAPTATCRSYKNSSEIVLFTMLLETVFDLHLAIHCPVDTILLTIYLKISNLLSNSFHHKMGDWYEPAVLQINPDITLWHITV